MKLLTFLAMVQHSDLHVVPWYNPYPFAFGFNKVVMADQLRMVQYQFQIISHGLLQTHF